VLQVAEVAMFCSALYKTGTSRRCRLGLQRGIHFGACSAAALAVSVAGVPTTRRFGLTVGSLWNPAARFVAGHPVQWPLPVGWSWGPCAASGATGGRGVDLF